MHRDVKKQFSPELFFRSHLRTRVAAQRHARGTRAGRRRRPRTPSGHAKRPGDLRMNRHAAVCPAVYLTIQAFGTLNCTTTRAYFRMNTPPQRHGAGAGASGDAQVPWVTLEEVGVESVLGFGPGREGERERVLRVWLQRTP